MCHTNIILFNGIAKGNGTSDNVFEPSLLHLSAQASECSSQRERLAYFLRRTCDIYNIIVAIHLVAGVNGLCIIPHNL